MKSIKRGIVMVYVVSHLWFLPMRTRSTYQTIEQKSERNVIIFDLNGVLFQEDRMAFIKKIGWTTIARCALSSWSNPENSCLDMLQEISNQENKKSDVPLKHKDRVMPHCMLEWQLGKKSNQEVLNELACHIDQLDQKKYFKSSHEKELNKKILAIGLDSQEIAQIAKPIPSTLELVKTLKKQGYKLYALSNLAQEIYDTFIKKYPDIVALFDGIMISAHVQLIKPDPGIYTQLLSQFNLSPKQCIFIDNMKENTDAAEKIGITSIVHKNARSTKAQLAKLGIK